MKPTLLAALAAAALLAGSARAQLQPEEVLVIYDSRVADSRAVAEMYAGSARVPGGTGGVTGVRRGVRVLDLASTGAAVTTPGLITYTDFATKLRDPIRAYLTASGLDRTVRCLVLTKGLPHRMDDSDAILIGDNPPLFIDEFNAQDVTCASVDSELTLLWQNLSAGENGNAADSKDDGLIVNPYWKLSAPLRNFPTTNIHVQKTYVAAFGPVYQNFGSGAARLTPGDMYLVCRLDGNTLADVQGMLNRGSSIMYNVETDNILLDEANSNGVADTSANGELDNQAGLAAQRAGDDYEKTRDYVLNTDRRFAPALVRYDALANASNFFIGPRLSPIGGVLITGPVALLATAGSNHAGSFPTTGTGESVAIIFARSFNYANGAIFNTIESFNGKDFGGTGRGGIPQEQASEFIASGGTFAIGHVWEPLADTIADNEFLVSNFLEGNLSWAEAAWSSIPSLSWMHVVIGDPLARPARTSEDVNADGRIGVGDMYAFEVSPTDIDRSGAANTADRLLLVRSVRSDERAGLVQGRP